MTRLNQVLAIEKGTKNRNETAFTKIHQELQKGDLVTGFTKNYQPKDADGERFPSEVKRVQVKAEDEIRRAKKVLAELFDIRATKDATNCVAKADVIVDGEVLLKDVPATHLLFIEQKLVDILTFVKKLPVLSQDEVWEKDGAQGLWMTQPVEALKTKKVMKHVTVVQPTKEHPAQVREVAEDVTVGTWTTVKYSGAIPASRVDELVERVEKLQKAVKFAREAANTTTVVELKSGDAILGYIFK